MQRKWSANFKLNYLDVAFLELFKISQDIWPKLISVEMEAAKSG
jgi:hypothetical protein